MQSNGTFRKILVGLVLGLFAASCAKEPPPPPPPPPPVVEEEVAPPVDTGPTYQEGSLEHMVALAGADRVFFAYDSDELVNAARETLRAQAEWLNAYRYVTVTIEGHADERGTREYNLALGERRAVSVKNFLVALGVESRRIATISYGKERPDALGHTEAAWSQNRRGTTIVN